jgi:hypothetical protein
MARHVPIRLLHKGSIAARHRMMKISLIEPPRHDCIFDNRLKCLTTRQRENGVVRPHSWTPLRKCREHSIYVLKELTL